MTRLSPRWRWTAGAAALVVLCLLAAVSGRQWIASHVVQRASAALRERCDCVLTAGRAELALTSLTLTLYDVRLAHTTAPEPPLAIADRVTVDVALAAIAGDVVFDRVAIVNPKLSWTPARVGVPSARASPGSLPAISVGRLEIENLDAVIATSSSERLTVRGLSASFDGAGPGRMHGTVRVGQGVLVETGGVATTVDEVHAELSIEGATLALRSFVARSPVGELRLDGRIGFADGGAYQLTYAGTLDVEALDAWLQTPGASGRVVVNGAIAGALSDPEATFAVETADLETAAIGGGHFEARGHAATSVVVVDAWSLKADGIQADGRARIALRDDSESSALVGRWSTSSIRTLARLAERPHANVPPLPLSGTVDVSWSGALPALATLAGDVRVTVRTPDAGSLALTGRTGRWTLAFQQALAGETRARLDLDAVVLGQNAWQSPLRGSLDVESDDLAAVIHQIRGLGIPIPPALDALTKGHVTLRGSVGGSIAEPTVNAKVGGADLSVGGHDDIRVEGTIALDRQQIVLTPLIVDHPAGRLELLGSSDLGGTRSDGEFELRVDRPDLLTPMLPPEWYPTGRLQAGGSWTGSPTRPHVLAHVRGQNLVANGLEFPSLGGEVELSGDTLQIHHLELRQPRGQLRVDGTYDVRSTHLSANVAGRNLHISVDRLRQVSERTDIAAELENVAIEGRLEGPARRPSGAVSLSADAVRVNGRDAGAIVVRAHDEQGRVRVDLAAPRFAATAAATVSLESPWTYTATATLDGSNLVSLAALADVSSETLADYGATLSASADARGELEPLSISSATINVSEIQGEARGRPFALAQPVRLTYDGSKVAVAPFHINVGGLSARGGGTWSVTTPDSPTDAIDLALEGRFEDVTAFFPAAVRDDWISQGPIAARLKLRRASNAATVSGDVTARLTSLERTLRVAPGTPRPSPLNLSGEFRLTVDARAHSLAPGAIDGTIVVETGAIASPQASIAQRVPTRLRVANGWMQIEQSEWTLPGGTLSASGRIGLEPEHESDVRVVGATSLRLVDAFVPGRGDGGMAFDVRMQGTRAGWTYGGAIDLDDANLILPEGRVSFAAWSGRLALGDDAVVATGLHGQVNGGEVSIDGSVSRSGDKTATLTITARNVLLEVPRGLKSELDTELTWSSQDGRPHLAGSATMTADAYREPAAAMLRTVSALTGASRNAAPALPDWLSATTLDVGLQANGPLTLENSVGNLAMVPSLRLTGTVANPALNGSMDIVDEGRIRVGGRSYRLRESAVEFVPEQGLLPRLNILGETRIGHYDVTLRVSGPADAIETSLSSNPPLGERDLQSLLVTGQTAGLTGEASNTDAFAVGAVSGSVLGLAGEFVGLDSVQVGSSDDLQLVSSDIEPSTRLTVSKRLGSRFELVLSENLDDNELTWVLIYRPRPGYAIGLASHDGTETTLEFRQELAFGPGYSAPRAARRDRRSSDVVSRIAVNGDPGFSPEEVRDALSLGEGDAFDFREWSRDRERIRRFYCDRGFCGVRVTPTRAVTETPTRREVVLDYRIIRGSRTELDVVGYPASDALLERLKTAWGDILVPQLLEEELVRVARGHLIDEGHLRARVDAALDSSRPGITRATITIAPGTKTTAREIVFEGNQAIDTMTLQQLVLERDPSAAVWKDSAPLIQELAAEYQSRGFLAARLTPDDLVFDGDRAVLAIRVVEGPIARVATLRVDGVAAGRRADTDTALGLAVGATYVQGAERTARARLERYYRDVGYRDARVDAKAAVSGAEGRADLAFTVTEGPLSIVRGVTVEGVHATNDGLVDRAVTVKPGAPAGQIAAVETQRRLYGLGTFRAAEVRFQPAATAASGDSRVVDAVIAVQEPRRYLLRYGVALSDEYEPTLDETQRSLGFASDLRDRNFLGRGIGLGLGVRFERDLSSLRGLVALPRLRSLPIRTNVSLTARKEDQRSETVSLFSDAEYKLAFEQRWQPGRWVELSWGYSGAGRRASFEFVDPSAAPFSFDGVLASLNATSVFDRRDSVFDASRGWFQSTSVQWGLRTLGSDFDYLRLLLRGSYYQSLGPVVFASNARWGQLTSLGGVPPLTVFDLFFKAGGTQTVRGYKQDELTGYEAFGVPLGGTRLVVLNQEIRVPIAGIFKGVVFADAGNTFAERARMSPSDLAVGVGFGLRIKTPLAPVRIDLGYPLPFRPGSSVRWHFSIGQMF